MIYYTKVLLPIEVADGDYCWGLQRICPHFDNEGGHPTCDLGIDWMGDSSEGLKYNKKEGYVEKPEFCKNLDTR